jgi:peptidyl-prolyl cis-trans isomerase D
MALISELRKRSWLVLVFIALALIGFLFMDAFNSNSGILQSRRDPFAQIDGQDISPAQLDARYSEVLIQYLTQSGQILGYLQGEVTIDNQTEFQLKEQAWNDVVQSTLMERERTALGLQVTDQEKTDLIFGSNPHPYIKNYYAGLSQNGVFDPALFNQYVNNIKDPQVQQSNPQAVQAYYDFLMRQSLAIREYTYNKYVTMISKADFVPEWRVKYDYTLKNRRANFDFVDIQFTTVADSTIEVTDSELKAYYNKHKNKFKQNESTRVLEYVVFPFTPTASDSAEIMGKLREDMAKLATAKSDSAFIAVRSEDPERITRAFQTRTYFYESGIDSSIVDSLFNAAAGSVVGPYEKPNFYTATLIKERVKMPDSADARHILVSNQIRSMDSARLLADSILTAIKGGADFTALAQQYSEDPGSASTGGELGWSTPQTDYVKPFKDFIFRNGQVGVPSLVGTAYGFHIIEIKELKGRSEYLLAYNLSRFIDASSATADSIDRIANEFFNTYTTLEDLAAGAAEKGYVVRTTPPFGLNQYDIPGLAESRNMITWAFGAATGEFNYFNTFSDRIIIAAVQSSRDKGIASLEDVEDQVRVEVIREKKGVMLAAKLEAAAAGGKDLNTIASSVQSAVKSSTNASLGTPYAPGIGLEPAVVGQVMATPQDGTTGVIAGNRAAYIARVTAITEPPADADLTQSRTQMTYGFRNKVNQQSILGNLTDKADIEDNRFQYGY